MRTLFLERYGAAVRRSAALIDSACAVDGSFVPCAGYRSIDEQIAHLFATRASILRGLESGEFAWSEETTRALAAGAIDGTAQDQGDMKRDGGAMLAELDALLKNHGEEWLNGVAGMLSRRAWLWALLEHEIHHAGQLSLSIRLAGGVPATIFE